MAEERFIEANEKELTAFCILKIHAKWILSIETLSIYKNSFQVPSKEQTLFSCPPKTKT